jgi:uncharacterized protein DUF3857/transglutaminase superfamily protein
MSYLRFLLVLSVAVSAYANQPWTGAPFSSDPKALLAAAAEVKPNATDEGVVVLLDEAHYTFDEKGLMTRTQRLLFRVIEESWAESWSSIEAPWSPWYEEPPKIEGRVVAADGSVHMLDPKSFSVADADEEPNMFSDTRVMSGPLPAVAAGSVVEQVITYHSKPILYDGGLSERHRFGRRVETQLSRLVIDYPATLPFHLVNRTMPEIKPARSENAGVVTLVFETRNLAGLKNAEWNLPTGVSNWPYVAFSTGKSWQDAAQKYATIIEKQIGSTESLAKLTTTSAGDAKEPLAVAGRLLASVLHNVRYAGVEFGEGSIVPRTPSETLEHKYGDCKDKATLLVAMLRQAGIPASVALLVAGEELDIDPETPGIGHFNHVIVVIPGANPIWIDPTDEFARAGELPDSDQGRLALIASATTTALALTPQSPASANRTVETREFLLPEDGKSTLVETSVYSGSEERSMRRYYASHDAKTIREGLEKYVKDAFLADSLGKYETTDPHDLSKPFTLRVETTKAGRGITTGGEAAVGIFAARLIDDMPWSLRSGAGDDDEGNSTKPESEKRKPRVHDFIFSEPHVIEMHYRVTPPAGYTLRTLPEKETVTLATATITKEFVAQPDGVVLVNYAFDSGSRRITAAQFEEMRKKLGEISNEKAYLLYFDQIGRKYLDAGEVGKAVAEFRRLAALHPAEALHHVDVAKALLAGGMGAAARREAKRAVEIEPKSAAAHEILGLALANDLIGREFGTGCDVRGAIAEYRKAKELDPKDINVRAEFAALLERNNDGERYGAGAPLDEAISEYISIKKDVKVDNDAVDRELMVLYARTGRFADLQKLIDATKDTQQKDAYALVAKASLQGGPAAITAANSIELSKRRAALSTAASVLAVMRRYPEAADLMNAAAAGAPNAAQLRAQVELMRKMKRSEEIPAAPNDPRDVLRRFFLSAMKDHDVAAMKQFMTPDIIDVFEGDGISTGTAQLEREGNAFRAQASKEGNVSFILDIALAAFDVQQDGSDDVGYRLLGRAPSGSAGSEMTVFVVRDNGAYRLAAFSFAPAMLGYRALRLAESGKLDAARQWLDWARDYVNTKASDDPLSSPPFTAFWQSGSQESADAIRLAAATLLPETKNSAKLALPILLAARDKTPDDAKWRIDQALAFAYEASKNWTELLATADRLSAKYPDSQRAFRFSVRALMQLNRAAEADQRAVARLQKMPKDRAAIQAIADIAFQTANFARAEEYYAKAMSLPNLTAQEYNSHSWVTLFMPAADRAKAIEEARRGVEMAPTSHAVLNTLAALYADDNKTSEARETLLQSLEESTSAEPQGADWFVLGRIAESYGINDAAIEAYERVTKPKEEVHGSAWELAQKRLTGLRTKPM